MKIFFCWLILTTLSLTVMAETLPDPVKQTLARSSLGANNELVASPEDQRVLYSFVKQSWQEFLPELSAQNLTAQENQLLIQASIEALPDSDYLPFVSTVLRLFIEGKLPTSVGMSVIMPSKSDKEGFLAMNYQEPDLASALRAAVPKLDGNPQLQTFVEGILSGAAKEKHVNWTLEQGMQARPAVNAAINPVASVPNITTPAAEAQPVATPTEPTPTPVEAASKPSLVGQAESPKSFPWPWIIGAILLLAIAGGILLKLRRK